MRGGWQVKQILVFSVVKSSPSTGSISPVLEMREVLKPLLILLALFYLTNGLINDINCPFHFLPANNQRRSQGQHIAFNGFGGKSFSQAFKHYDLGLIHRPLPGLWIADQIDADVKPQGLR